MIIVSEPGVYRLVFRSRKPEAERFKRWLAHEVLPALRRGACVAPAAPTPSPDIQQEPLIHRLQLVRECRAIHGREVAKAMWRQLGLPAVPPPPPTAIDEAKALLRHLLDAVPPGGEGPMRVHLAGALEDGENDRLVAMCGGIRPQSEGREGFLVANRHPHVDAVLKGTPWSGGRHVRVLRRLPGTASAQARFMAHQSRATFVPVDYLDEDRDDTEKRLLAVS